MPHPHHTSLTPQAEQTMLDVGFSHYVQIKYFGATDKRPYRFVASWQGWPSEGPRVMRKTMPYTSDRNEMANAAAVLFAEWLSNQPSEDPACPRRVIYAPSELKLGYIGKGTYALLIAMKATALRPAAQPLNPER